jgi:arrestin-related trafficking adapter 4/5/7
LCLTEPLTIKHLKLTLTGVSKIEHNPGYSKSSKKARENVFYRKEWIFEDAGKAKAKTLGADNYEHPFDVVLPGSLSESVEGLPDSFIIYRFKAEIGRRCVKDIVIRKPLRIIRTLDSSTLELAHAMTVANIWPNKIEYSISTPSKAVIYGTSIQVDFRLVSLLKGLRIGTITSQLLEIQEVCPNPESALWLMNTNKSTRVVAEDKHAVPETPEVLDEAVEGYQFTRHIELPKSLTKCMQDAETFSGIKIRHKLKFNVLLHNPDKHTSELRATLPVSLYISPSLPINEDNELVDQTPVAARRALEIDMTNQAPPLYGDHRLDQMYSDVDFSGYQTPATFSTPGTPYRIDSRNISTENLSPGEPTGNGLLGLGPDGSRTGDVSAAALRFRLQNLRSGTTRFDDMQSSRDVSPASSRRGSAATGDHRSDSASSRNSSRHSRSRSCRNRSRPVTPSRRSSSGSGATLSRRTSGGDDDQLPSGAHTPGSPILEAEHLSRVPSYSTAVRVPARTAYSGSDLPSYGVATSQNASLSLSPNSGQINLPPTAHVRGRTSRSTGSFMAGPSSGAAIFYPPELPVPMEDLQARSVAGLHDDSRNMRTMQVRGRA